MTFNRLFLSILASLTVGAACGSDSDGTDSGDTETSVEGNALYRDATTDHSGSPQAASAPPEQRADIRIDVRGTGTLTGIEPRCSLDGASGAFEGVYQSELSLDEDGLYAALLASTSAEFVTPTGCEIPDLTIAAMTEIVIRAEIAATTQNCETFCAAHARAEAEAECGATADAAACRTAAETDVAASCTTSCVAEDHRIVAEAALSADTLARINAGGLTGTALGSLDVDLVFDHVATRDGTPVVGL